MIAYVGDTRSRALLARCREAGVGQIIIRGRLRGRRLDCWAYDNGAFEDFRAERPFDGDRFAADLEEIATMEAKPAFLVLPDVVAGGLASLELSVSWWSRVPQSWPWYLAVQDGMTEDAIPWGLGFRGLFVGGALPWKLATGASWVAAAHARGLQCHIGRVGTARRIAWARDARADSIDSCLPLWSKENARGFFDTLAQRGLF